jgi:hypothetical protein
MRLLLVEDHHDTARTISRLLRSAGFTVTTPTDVASASAAADKEPFDVLVSERKFRQFNPSPRACCSRSPTLPFQTLGFPSESAGERVQTRPPVPSGKKGLRAPNPHSSGRLMSKSHVERMNFIALSIGYARSSC